MKKLSFLVLFVIIISSSILAQSASGRESDYRFAFVLNPQVSWLKSDHSGADGNGNLMGYNFGVEMDKFFAKNYAISTGLTINTTGGKLRYNQDTNIKIGSEDEVLQAGESLEYRLKYIEVPLSLKLQTNDFQRTSYYGVFGMSSQFNIKTNDGSGKNINDEVRFLNLGYQFGGGLQYSLGGDAYMKFGIVYNQGITDITNNSQIDDTTILNRLVFNFGIIF